MLHRVLVCAYLALVLVDIVTSYLGLSGGVPEGNLVPRWVYLNWGHGALILRELVVTLGALYVVIRLQHRYRRLWWAIYTLTAVYAYVAVNNLSVIARMY